MNSKILNIFYKFLMSEPKKLLGRWNIDYNTKKINIKVDLSNEDHCGPCGQYVLSKRKNIENINVVPKNLYPSNKK